MTIRDLNKDHPGPEERASYCVVGAGIAGLLLATRLARQNRQVIVLESGRLEFDPHVHALNEIEDVTGRYTRALTGRYRGLGGSSSRWGGRMIPINPADAAARAHIGQPAWPITPEMLARYTHEIEDMFVVGHDSFEEIETAAPGAAGLLCPGGEEFATRWAKCPSFRRCNIISILGHEIKASHNLTVWLNATATGFELDRERGRLGAIEARSLAGRTIKIRADEFIFAAGAIETTRLLLLLNADSDERAFAGTTALGRYFQDHLKADIATVTRRRPHLTNHLLSYRYVKGVRRDLHLELSPQAQREDGVASAFVYVAMDLGNGGLAALKGIAHGIQQRRIDAQHVRAAVHDVGLLATGAFWRLRYRQLYVPPQINFRLMCCVEQLPDARNRIRLGVGTDRLGMRLALVDWQPRPAEALAYKSATLRFKRYWRRSGLDALCPLIWLGSAGDDSILSRTEPCAHPSGSTRMGTDPATSVVGPDLRCHTVPNLAIASASVFPTAGSANPTLTIMQLALRLADSYRLSRWKTAGTPQRSPARAA